MPRTKQVKSAVAKVPKVEVTKPRNAKAIFMDDTRKKEKGLSEKELKKKVASLWKELTPEQKKKFTTLAKLEKAGTKGKKDPDAPKKVKSAYSFFTQEQLPLLKEKGTVGKEAIKAVGAMWKEMSEDAKKPYQDQNAADKERYQKELTQGKPVDTEE